MITDKDIELAKQRTDYNSDLPNHEHNDCIRIAYEWLDAQNIISNISSRKYDLKHLIEEWAGRYVSKTDVLVAAEMHPGINGKYPFFNISSRLTEPSLSRLEGIGEAFNHSNYRDGHNPRKYKIQE